MLLWSSGRAAYGYLSHSESQFNIGLRSHVSFRLVKFCSWRFSLLPVPRKEELSTQFQTNWYSFQVSTLSNRHATKSARSHRKVPASRTFLEERCGGKHRKLFRENGGHFGKSYQSSTLERMFEKETCSNLAINSI